MDGPKSLNYYLDLFKKSHLPPSIERCSYTQNISVEKYVDTWSNGWKDLVKKYADEIPPLTSKVRVVGLIPARNEEYRIISCLDALEYDVCTSNMCNTFELIILENGNITEIGQTYSSVSDWIRRHMPLFSIHCLKHSWDKKEKYPLAKARKLLSDIVIYRMLKTKPNHPIYLLSEDADIEHIQKGRMRAALLKLDRQPWLDAIRGMQERSIYALKQNHLALLERRSWQFTELLLSSKRYWPENNKHYNFYWHRVVTAGSNVFFSAEIYSLIGGYSSDVTVFEDMDIGQRISVLRGYYVQGRFFPRLNTIQRFSFREEFSIARILLSLVNKGHVYSHDGTGFYDVDHLIKQPNSIDLLLNKLAPYARPDRDNITMYEQVISNLKMEIQRIFNGDTKGDQLFSRVMSYLCIPNSVYNYRAIGEKYFATNKTIRDLI